MNLKELFSTPSWWGKFLCALLGYLSAGPAGAVFGLILGNFFDRSLVSHFANPYWYYLREPNPNIQQMFFQATYTVMGYIAKADGRVSEQELAVARLFMNEMQLNKAQKKVAMQLFTEGKNQQFNINAMVTHFYRVCNANQNLLKLFMDIQYKAAQVDGLTANKIQALDNIFAQLGYAPFHKQYRFYEDFGTHQTHQQQSSSESYTSYSNSSYQSTRSNLDHAFAIMDLSHSASKQEVKRAYRRLISQNHPDKLIAKGYSQAQIKQANEKTQKIIKAYELICKSKGW